MMRFDDLTLREKIVMLFIICLVTVGIVLLAGFALYNAWRILADVFDFPHRIDFPQSCILIFWLYLLCICFKLLIKTKSEIENDV